jgi:hypothetical protein
MTTRNSTTVIIGRKFVREELFMEEVREQELLDSLFNACLQFLTPNSQTGKRARSENYETASLDNHLQNLGALSWEWGIAPAKLHGLVDILTHEDQSLGMYCKVKCLDKHG